jgi:hypothetical protein
LLSIEIIWPNSKELSGRDEMLEAGEVQHYRGVEGKIFKGKVSTGFNMGITRPLGENTLGNHDTLRA